MSKFDSRKNLSDLTVGERFVMEARNSIYTVTGIATNGNLTRVSYLSDNGGPEYTFTKVNLTSVWV